jgi:hypothetical protein
MPRGRAERVNDGDVFFVLMMGVVIGAGLTLIIVKLVDYVGG